MAADDARRASRLQAPAPVTAKYSITMQYSSASIPPLRIGNFALDLSFLIVLVAAYVLLRVNRMVFLS